MNTHTKPIKPPRHRAPQGEKKVSPLLSLLLAFAGGAGAAAALLSVFAAVDVKAGLSLNLIRPLAFAAVGVGALVAGLILASLLRKNRLACGAGCGAFFAACLLIATAINGTVTLAGANIGFLLALVAAGAFGGLLSALCTHSSPAAR